MKIFANPILSSFRLYHISPESTTTFCQTKRRVVFVCFSLINHFLFFVDNQFFCPIGECSNSIVRLDRIFVISGALCAAYDEIMSRLRRRATNCFSRCVCCDGNVRRLTSRCTPSNGASTVQNKKLFRKRY